MNNQSLLDDGNHALLDSYIGQDKIRGRPIRLNKQRLELKRSKEYAEMILFGDLHFGHPCCDIERAKRQIKYCLEKGIYVLGMGDYIETGLRGSVGDSVYQQKLNPQKQMDFMIDFLKPLARKGLLLGLLIGNHEGRIQKDTSVNPVKIMAKILRVPYLGYACWNLFYVGDESYTIYTIHGTTGSRFDHTKLKAAIDISHYFDADIVAMAHVHSCIDDEILVHIVDRKRKMIVERKKFIVVTGHYLSYDDSYAQEKGLPPARLGSPKVKLFSKKHDVHISW